MSRSEEKAEKETGSRSVEESLWRRKIVSQKAPDVV